MPRVRKQYDDKSLILLVRNIAKMLRYYREELGFSQNQLGKISGVSISTINEIENGNVNDVRLSTICTLSRHLKVEPLRLITPTNIRLDEEDKKSFKDACKILNRTQQRLS